MITPRFNEGDVVPGEGGEGRVGSTAEVREWALRPVTAV
jgi:hypothetical protein